uniref:Protein kinase domain-containing protein n=1 Tax=Macrostomum lignano TaxID=282301 RepID=A0A1I8JRN8_9PLAT
MHQQGAASRRSRMKRTPPARDPGGRRQPAQAFRRNADGAPAPPVGCLPSVFFLAGRYFNRSAWTDQGRLRRYKARPILPRRRAGQASVRCVNLFLEQTPQRPGLTLYSRTAAITGLEQHRRASGPISKGLGLQDCLTERKAAQASRADARKPRKLLCLSMQRLDTKSPACDGEIVGVARHAEPPLPVEVDQRVVATEQPFQPESLKTAARTNRKRRNRISWPGPEANRRDFANGAAAVTIIELADCKVSDAKARGAHCSASSLPDPKQNSCDSMLSTTGDSERAFSRRRAALKEEQLAADSSRQQQQAAGSSTPANAAVWGDKALIQKVQLFESRLLGIRHHRRSSGPGLRGWPKCFKVGMKRELEFFNRARACGRRPSTEWNQNDSDRILTAAKGGRAAPENPVRTSPCHFVRRFVKFVKILPEFELIGKQDAGRLIKGGAFNFILMRRSGHLQSTTATASRSSWPAQAAGTPSRCPPSRQCLADSPGGAAIDCAQRGQAVLAGGYLLLKALHRQRLAKAGCACNVYFRLLNRLTELESLGQAVWQSVQHGGLSASVRGSTPCCELFQQRECAPARTAR